MRSNQPYSNYRGSGSRYYRSDNFNGGSNDDDINRQFTHVNLNGGRGRGYQGSRGGYRGSSYRGGGNRGQQWNRSATPRGPTSENQNYEPLPTEVEESVRWYFCSDDARHEAVEALKQPDRQWMTEGERKLEFDFETAYCSKELLEKLLDTKDSVHLRLPESVRLAMPRQVNPYECVRSGGFRNRWSLKVANIDRIADFVFSGEEDQDSILTKNPLDGTSASNCDRDKELFYFADVCGGPGGFSEYMTWRKGFYNCKGFGFTLKNAFSLLGTEDDWILPKFMPATGCFFERFYGRKGTGDIRDPDNIDEFEEHVRKETNDRGVDLMMSDAHIPTPGQDNIQEILAKRLYLCEMLISLCIVKDGGNYMSTVFDVFTPFSAGLIYLMSVCYETIALHKPRSCRPGNGERVNRKLAELERSEMDVTDVVPADVLRADAEFTRYLTDHNEMSTRTQLVYLERYHNSPVYDPEEMDALGKRCLDYWKVPCSMKSNYSKQPQHLLEKYLGKMISAEQIDENLPFFENSESSNSKAVMMVSTTYGTYVWKGAWKKFPMGRIPVRIPFDTILLIEEPTTAVKSNSNDVRKQMVPPVADRNITILDAAVLYGDNVSQLSYDKRMKAASKMCQALKSDYSEDGGYRLIIK